MAASPSDTCTHLGGGAALAVLIYDVTMGKLGGANKHIAAGQDNKHMGPLERYALRTGKAHGKSGKAERKIIANREERRRLAKADAGGGIAVASASRTAGTSSLPPPSTAAGGSTMYRRYQAQEREKEARAAAATNVLTAGSASYLETLRATMRAEKQKASEPEQQEQHQQPS